MEDREVWKRALVPVITFQASAELSTRDAGNGKVEEDPAGRTAAAGADAAVDEEYRMPGLSSAWASKRRRMAWGAGRAS